MRKNLFTNFAENGIINNSMKKALVTGSFDPITFGHIDIIMRTLSLYDMVYVGIGNNVGKVNNLLPVEERCKLIAEYFAGNNKVTIFSYSSLTVDAAKKYEVDCIVRGVRNTREYEAEKEMALTNKKLSGIETLLMPASPEYSYISSSLVREVFAFSKDISQFVPENVARKLNELKGQK